jgi:hypothetical protein
MRTDTDLVEGVRGWQTAALIFASGRTDFYAFQNVNVKSIVPLGEAFLKTTETRLNGKLAAYVILLFNTAGIANANAAMLFLRHGPGWLVGLA